MRFPLTRDAMAAAFEDCCGCLKINVEFETELEITDEFETAEERERLANKEAEKIFKEDDWRELNDGYTRKYYKINSNGMRVGEELTEFVKMNNPRECSYSSKTSGENGNDITIEETRIIKVDPAHNSPSRKPGAECNGITPRQLRAVMAMITRRCEAEEWRDFNGTLLTPDSVTLYDVNRYIIKPFTIETQISFVETLPSTAGPQPPRFFISHWWGETVVDFLSCLEQAILDFRFNNNGVRYCGGNHESRGGGMTEDTPVWICAYANNQWSLSGDITADPKESGFTKAMKIAKGRTITILDKEGIVFSRIWCIFELYLTLVDSQAGTAGENSKDGLWAVYTAHSHTYKSSWAGDEERKALGIIAGWATSDLENSYRISAREDAFPYDLIEKSLSIQVEVAKASVEDDRRHILNSIAGRSIEDIDNAPLVAHENYVRLNDSLRGTFASSKASLKGAAEKDDRRWQKMIEALSNGTTKGQMHFDFRTNGSFCGLNEVRAIQMVAHLPLTIDQLEIWGGKYGSEFSDALIERVNQFHNLKTLWIDYTSVNGEEKRQEEIGLRLAKIMSASTTIETLGLGRTDFIGADNVEQWGDAFMENNTLTKLMLNGVGNDIVDKLKTKTKNRALKLKFDIRQALP